jgi:electron-transferring-flavoprotein dehydrogenase
MPCIPVYEVVYADEARRVDPRFVIDAQNCVHCKTCDINRLDAARMRGGPNYPDT